VILDHSKISPGMPRVVHDLPDGSRRLEQPAVGIDVVMCNGQVTLRDGDPTGTVSGQNLRPAGKLVASAEETAWLWTTTSRIDTMVP
jgi:N-acyl-D-aspartate/D-glutamate deacylase